MSHSVRVHVTLPKPVFDAIESRGLGIPVVERLRILAIEYAESLQKTNPAPKPIVNRPIGDKPPSRMSNAERIAAGMAELEREIGPEIHHRYWPPGSDRDPRFYLLKRKRTGEDVSLAITNLYAYVERQVQQRAQQQIPAPSIEQVVEAAENAMRREPDEDTLAADAELERLKHAYETAGHPIKEV